MEVIAFEYPPPYRGDILRAAVISIGEAAASIEGLELATIGKAEA